MADLDRVPTFVRCTDGKFYQDLVYQDLPSRRAWFLCFSDIEPAELVVREDFVKGDMGPRTILQARGFAACFSRLLPARKLVHKRFFGVERNTLTGEEKPIEGHPAVSWFLAFKKGVALPAPTGQDSCAEIYPYFPNKPGVYFGDNR